MCLWEDTFTRNYRLCDGFKQTLYGTIYRRGCCGKTEVCEADEILWAARKQAKSIRHVSWDTKFANNFMISR